MRVRLLGTDHPDTTRSRYALAGLLRAKGDAEGALRECRRVLALRGRVLPDSHPVVAAILQIMGLALVDLGRPREAEPLLRESLGLRRQALPPGHWLVASSESVLGSCLTAEGRYREAEALLLRAQAALESSGGQGYDAKVEARRRLVALYEAWGRPDRAAALRDP
jgi:serine/threonine-protein kinase